MIKVLQIFFIFIAPILLMSCAAGNLSDSDKASSYDINQTSALDEDLINQILTQDTANLFIVPNNMLLKHIARSIKYNPDRGRVLFRVYQNKIIVETKGDTLFVPKASRHKYTKRLINKTFELKKMPELVNPDVRLSKPYATPIFPGGDGTVFIFFGKVNNYYGDEADPLRYVYLKDKGLVYLGGSGKVTDAAGSVLFDSTPIDFQ